jgi:hypothetical protein
MLNILVVFCATYFATIGKQGPHFPKEEPAGSFTQ